MFQWNWKVILDIEVEIDSKIIEVANEHFGLENSNVEVFEDDGRRFINKSQKKYDLIVLDVFNGEIAPSHVLSREAFLQLRVCDY